MNQPIIATLIVPAVATTLGWMRSAKTVHITDTTPAWMLKTVVDFMNHVSKPQCHRVCDYGVDSVINIGCIDEVVEQIH